MNDNLITEIIDLNKVKANLTELREMWEQLITTMAAKSTKDLKFGDLAQNLKVIAAAETELANVKKANLELEKKLEAARKRQEADSKKRIAQAEKEAKAIEAAAQKQAAAENKAAQSTIAARKKKEEALQKEKSKFIELVRTANMVAKTDAEINAKLKAQITLRGTLNQEIPKQKKRYDELTESTRKLYEQQNQANKSYGKFTNEVGRYPQNMETAQSSISKFSVGAVAAYAAIAMAAKQVYAAVKDVIVEFLQADKVQQLVNQSFGKYSDVITEQANAFEKATGIEAEQFMRLSISAKAYGSANEDVAKSINLSLGLAKEFELQGVDSETALKALVKAQNGQYAGLEKIYPALKNVASESEKMRIVNELSAKGWEKLNAYTATYSGQIDLVNHAVGNLKEESGKQILEGILGKPEEIGKATSALDKVTETLEKTGVISKYLRMMREQAMMMLEPFLNLFKIFGDGGSAIDGLAKAVDVWMFIMKAVQTPVRLLWSYLAALTGVVLDVVNAFRNIKDLKFQDVLNIINKAFVTLLSPISDLVGMSDEVSRFFGVQREQISLTAEEQKKLNDLLFDYKSIIKDVKKTIATNEEMKQLTEDLEEQEKVVDEVNKRYTDYIANVKKINEDARLSIELGESRIEVRKKEIEAIYSATKAYFELNGYTADEIKKLKELRSEIDKLNAEIANAPKLLKKQDVKTLESAAKATGEISMNMRDVSPSANDAAAGLEKMDLITAKLRNAFNDFFGATEPIEDWRDTFKESITTVVNESFELYNQIIDLQNEKFNQELDNLDRLYDKQMSGLESTYDRRKKLLEATIDDEEQLAAELARIEEEKADVQAKFQDDKFKKEQEIAKKQAILAKKKAAMEVAAGSASAMVDAVKLIGIATTAAAPGDPYSLVARIAAALAAALTVVGAVTAGISKVKAIEIPQFWAGGEAQEGQLISVAERGREIAVGESGQSYMFDKQSVLVAPEKMRIFSNQETKQIMEKQTINNTYEKSNNVNLTVNIDNERHKKYFKLT